MLAQIGIVPLTIAFITGVFAFAGLYHLMVTVRRRDYSVHLTFAATCILAAVWAGFGIPRYTAHDPAAYMTAVVARQSLGALMGVALVWFFAAFSDERPKWVLWTITLALLAVVAVNETSEFGVSFTGVPRLVFHTLPWGETVTVATEPKPWWSVLQRLTLVLPFLFGWWTAYRLWGSRRRREAVALTTALTLIFLALLDVLDPLFGSFPTTELAFLGLIVIMSLTMAHELVEAGAVRQALTRSQARLAAVVESAPEAIMLLHGETGGVIVANPQAAALFGIGEEEVDGFRPAGSAPPEQLDGEASEQVFGRHLAAALGGRRVEFRWVVRSAEGRDISCRGWLVRLPGDDPPLVRLSLIDLRALEEAEAQSVRLEEQLRQSQKLEAVGRLTGGVAHDFNNFLTVMRGSLGLLQEDGLDQAERQTLFGEALSAVERSASLTQRLLAFSRRQPLMPRVVDMRQTIDHAGVLLRRTLGEHIRIEYDVAEDIWPTCTDPAQLESAIVNLSINAADAMEEGGRLTVGARNVLLEPDDYEFMDLLAPGEYVRVHVTDTGHGMDAQTVERVIEPFFTTKEVGKGTGLGLSMAYGFATQSNGTLRIESEVGEGTTVFLYFPRTEGDCQPG
jgi:PAS domain S-box-containing protein